MNASRRKQIAEAIELLNRAVAIIQGAASDERDAYDSLPESLQEGERGQAMSEAADALEEVEGSIEDAIGRLEEAAA